VSWGGIAAFGLVRIFVGPVTLAVTYTFLKAWVMDEEVAESSAGGAPEDAPPAYSGEVNDG